MITSITAWKKALQPGDTVRVVNHRRPVVNGIRDVMRVQTNAFTTRCIREDGEEVESWFYYPKSTFLKLSEDGRTLQSFENQGDAEPWLSYTVLEGKAAS